MRSQNLRELHLDTVDFTNDWNHLPPNGNAIPPSTRSNLTLPTQDDSTDDEGTNNNNLVPTTTVVSPTGSTYYNPYSNRVESRSSPSNLNPYPTPSASPTRPVNQNLRNHTSVKLLRIKVLYKMA